MRNITLHTLILLLLVVTNTFGKELVILHTNDTHSQIEPTPKDLGGIARRLTFVDSVRQVNPCVLLLDAGDFSQGTPYFNFFGGDLEILAMNMLGYDAVTLGNHEFDNGIAALCKRIDNASFKVLNANYGVPAPLKQRISPYMLIEKCDTRIGVIGLGGDLAHTVSAENRNEITFEDPINAANNAAKTLRSQGADYIVVLSHIGYSNNVYSDTKMAAQLHNIDIIVGGHSHTLLTTPTIVPDADGKPIVIVQAGSTGANIGYLHLETDKEPQGRTFLLDAHYDSTPQKAWQDTLKSYKDQLDKTMQTPIGTAQYTLENKLPYPLLGNFACDALMSQYKKVGKIKPDMALLNYGGLRAPIEKGTISIGDIYRTFPFENTVVLVSIKGEQLIKVLQQCAHGNGEAVSDHVRVTRTPQGIISTIKGKFIDPHKIYNVLTLDFLANGNGGFTELKNSQSITPLNITMRDAMINYIKSLTKKHKSATAIHNVRFIL